jgi:hypothetical protein
MGVDLGFIAPGTEAYFTLNVWFFGQIWLKIRETIDKKLGCLGSQPC